MIDWLLENASTVGVLANLFLSVGLVILYYFQLEISMRQQNLMEYQQSAQIQVDYFELISSSEFKSSVEYEEFRPEKWQRNYDYAYLNISNYGTAPATDLQLEISVRGESREWETESRFYSGHWKDVGKSMKGPRLNIFGLNEKGDAIGPKESDQDFTAPITVPVDDLREQWDSSKVLSEEGTLCTPSRLTKLLLREEDESSLQIVLRLWYKDGTGLNGPINLAAREIGKRKSFTAATEGRPLRPSELPEPNA